MPGLARRLIALWRTLFGAPNCEATERREEGAGLKFSNSQSVKRLAEALADYDYEAIVESLAAAMKEDLGAEGAVLPEIKKLMRRFDYDRAAELLAEALRA